MMQIDKITTTLYLYGADEMSKARTVDVLLSGIEICAFLNCKFVNRSVAFRPLGACMLMESGDAANLGDFLPYTAMVAANMPAGARAQSDRIPPPFAYALMVGLNDLLLEQAQRNPGDDLETVEPVPKASFFHNVRNSKRRWFGSDAQLKKTVKQFESGGLIDSSASGIAPTERGVRLLLDHAKAVHGFFQSGNAALSRARRDWLELNQRIFQAFFYNDYGDAWRDLRSKVNLTIAKARGSGDRYVTDYIGESGTLWVIVNLLAVFGEIDQWEVDGCISRSNLKDIAGSTTKIGKKIEEMIDEGVLQKHGDVISFSTKIGDCVRFQTAVKNSMARLRRDCAEWQDATG